MTTNASYASFESDEYSASSSESSAISNSVLYPWLKPGTSSSFEVPPSPNRESALDDPSSYYVRKRCIWLGYAPLWIKAIIVLSAAIFIISIAFIGVATSISQIQAVQIVESGASMNIVGEFTGIPSISPSDEEVDTPELFTLETSLEPSSIHTTVPTAQPTDKPSSFPSLSSTLSPSFKLSNVPSLIKLSSTLSPSFKLSNVPSLIKSQVPSKFLSSTPSSVISQIPSEILTSIPSSMASSFPSNTLAPTPSESPLPTFHPSNIFSNEPSDTQTSFPSTNSPTNIPSITETEVPSILPSIKTLDLLSSHPSSSPIATSPRPSSSAVTQFFVMGDRFRDNEIFDLLTEMSNLPSDGGEFVVHLGDFNNIEKGCAEISYVEFRDFMEQNMPLPTFITPGDNDWNDCPDPNQAWSYWRSHIMGLDGHWSHHMFKVSRQTGENEENFAFFLRSVLYVGVHLVGGLVLDRDVWSQQISSNLEWVRSQMLLHEKDDMKALVLFGHDDSLSRYRDFFEPLALDVQNSGIPTLFIYESNEQSQVQKDVLSTSNLWFAEVQCGMIPFMKVTVDTSQPDNPFSFTRS